MNYGPEIRAALISLDKNHTMMFTQVNMEDLVERSRAEEVALQLMEVRRPRLGSVGILRPREESYSPELMIYDGRRWRGVVIGKNGKHRLKKTTEV